MATNNRIGSQPAPYTKQNSGQFLSGGPYVGIVKNNLDPTCSGRLQVFIPQLGSSDENNQDGWITVSYASPFRGQTRQRNDLNLYIDKNIDPTTTEDYSENSFQSYGFWFVPPDLNGRVLCFFANNDPSQGYWISCIADSLDSHMVPAIGGVIAATDSNGGYLWNPSLYSTHAALEKYIQISGPNGAEIPYRLPVSEPVLMKQANSSPSTPSAVVMVPQVFQSRQLGIQGLAFDFIRGTTSASSVRENPSQVFGISTPGRLTSFANAALSQEILSELSSVVNGSSDVDKDDLTKKMNCGYRTGGHQFVLDDGSVEGIDHGIRIRSSAGNEILLDDTNGQIYIINSAGTAWIELTPSGRIDVFGANSISMRSKGSINLHADKNINMNATENIVMHSGGTTQIDSASSITMRGTSGTTIFDGASTQIGTKGKMILSGKSGVDINALASNFNVTAGSLNLPGAASTVSDPKAVQLSTHVDVAQQSGSQAWWQTKDGLKSVCDRTPAHEPWSGSNGDGHEIDGVKTTTVQVVTAEQASIIRAQGKSTSSGIRGTSRSPQVTEADIAAQVAKGTVCELSLNETKALLASLSKQEVGFVASTSNPGKIGTYLSMNSTKQTSNPGVTTSIKGTSHKDYKDDGGTGYYAVNVYGYSGKYQFGADALVTAGYMNKGSEKLNGDRLNNSANWRRCVNGVTSWQTFLKNPDAQESAIIVFLNSICSSIPTSVKKQILAGPNSHATLAGVIGVAHLLGVGGAMIYYKQINPNSPYTPNGKELNQDGFGTGPSERFNACSNAVSSVTA